MGLYSLADAMNSICEAGEIVSRVGGGIWTEMTDLHPGKVDEWIAKIMVWKLVTPFLSLWPFVGIYVFFFD